MQVAELAAACERLGHPIAVQVIHNLETGRRTTVPVTDVLALAKALDVPAVLLIAPVDPPPVDTRDKVLADYPLDVESLPGRIVPSHVALEEITGEQLPADLLDGAASDRWLDAASVIDLYRAHRDLAADLVGDQGLGIVDPGDPPSPEDRASAVFMLGQIRERMAGRRLTLPELDPDLADELNRPRSRVRPYRPALHLALRGVIPEEPA
jgi:hypothetical protein